MKENVRNTTEAELEVVEGGGLRVVSRGVGGNHM